MQYENEKKSYLDLGEDCKVIFKVQLCLLGFCLFVYLVVCLFVVYFGLPRKFSNGAKVCECYIT